MATKIMQHKQENSAATIKYDLVQPNGQGSFFIGFSSSAESYSKH